MKKWEYTVRYLSYTDSNSIALRDELGLQGWELVSVTVFQDSIIEYYKREIEEHWTKSDITYLRIA